MKSRMQGEAAKEWGEQTQKFIELVAEFTLSSDLIQISLYSIFSLSFYQQAASFGLEFRLYF